jgi:ribosome assembly protein 4
MKQLKSSLKRIQREKERIETHSSKRVMLDFVDIQGNSLGETFDIELNSEIKDVNELLKKQLKDDDNDFTFFFKNYQLRENFKELIMEFKDLNTESTLKINYVPDSLIGIRPVTRISSSLEGHTQSVLDVSFSPNNKYLASCSGDKTIRLWDVNTETPVIKFDGFHKNWVLCVAWAPDSSAIASGDYNGLVAVTPVQKLKSRRDPKKTESIYFY